MEKEKAQIGKESRVQFVKKDAIETIILNAYKQAKYCHPDEKKLNITSVLKRMSGPLLSMVNRKIEKTINPQWQSEEMIVQGHKVFNPKYFKVVARDDAHDD